MTSRYATHGIGRRRRGSSLGFMLVVFVAISLIAAGLAAVYVISADEDAVADDLITHIVEEGPFENIVLEQGEVESSSNVEVVCEVESRNSSGTAILWVIDKSARVAEGEKLVELDASALELEIKQQRIIVNTSEALKISAEAELETAIIAKEEYVDGTFLQQEAEFEKEILVQKQAQQNATETARFSQRLAALGFITQLQLNEAEFKEEEAEVLMKLAENKLATLQKITRRKMLVDLDAAINKATAKSEAENKSHEEELEKLADLGEQIKKCVIFAPKAGQVVHANRYSSRGGSAEFVVEAGATVRERQTIIHLPDPDLMQVKASISEARVTLVKVGMPVAIQVGAFEEDVLEGRVKKVNRYAEPSSWFSSQVKKYATWVEIVNPPPNIRTGMTAEVRIIVDQKSSVLRVPVQTIHEEKGHTFCLLKKPDGFETREVTIGASNDKFIVIDKGLQRGDELVMNPRRHIELMDLPELPDPPDSVLEKPGMAAGEVSAGEGEKLGRAKAGRAGQTGSEPAAGELSSKKAQPKTGQPETGQPETGQPATGETKASPAAALAGGKTEQTGKGKGRGKGKGKSPTRTGAEE